MKKMIAMLLTVLMVLSLAGCGGGKDTIPALEDGAVVGEGSVSFALSIVDKEKQVDLTVNTDEASVGDALQKLHIVSGEEGEYGLYIKTVNGVTADYDTDGTYWAFYVDGVYAEKSADQTEINPDSVYTLKVETAE